MVPEKKGYQSPGPQNLGEKLETVSLEEKLGCRPALEDPGKTQGLSPRRKSLEPLEPVDLAVVEIKGSEYPSSSSTF